MKLGLEDIAKKILQESSKAGTSMSARNTDIGAALAAKDYPRLAQLEGVKLIQISESDTQVTSLKKAKGQFICSWNIPSFCEEAAASAEFPYGTHERNFPNDCTFFGRRPDEKSYIVMPKRAMEVLTKTYIPRKGEGEGLGTTPHHEETITISEYLSIRDDKDVLNGVGRLMYRPTVYFCYKPMPVATESLREFARNDYQMQSDQIIANDDIVDGCDSLGVFLGGHDFKGWWCGSLLSIHQTRAVAPHNNSTSLQVGISIVAAIRWAIKHPNSGVHFPETLPSEEVLEIAKPFLGTFVSQSVYWAPDLHASENGGDDRKILRPLKLQKTLHGSTDSNGHSNGFSSKNGHHPTQNAEHHNHQDHLFDDEATACSNGFCRLDSNGSGSSNLSDAGIHSDDSDDHEATEFDNAKKKTLQQSDDHLWQLTNFLS